MTTCIYVRKSKEEMNELSVQSDECKKKIEQLKCVTTEERGESLIEHDEKINLAY